MSNECCKISPEDQALLDAGEYTPEELFGVGGKPSCPKCFHATGDVDALKESRPGQRFEVVSDLDLERRALKACGYRVHEKERNGTRWLMAVKGLDVQYKHWHPLTSIHQAMQLLIDAPQILYVVGSPSHVETMRLKVALPFAQGEPIYIQTAQDLINAQCRAIVTACASIEPVR